MDRFEELTTYNQYILWTAWMTWWSSPPPPAQMMHHRQVNDEIWRPQAV